MKAHLILASICTVIVTACVQPAPAPASGMSSMTMSVKGTNGKPATTYNITATSVTATVSPAGKPAQSFTGRNMTEVQAKMKAAGY